MGWRPVVRCAGWELQVVPLLSIEEPGSVLEDLGGESVTLIHFRLSHAPDSGRLGVNLSVPKQSQDQQDAGPFLVLMFFTFSLSLGVNPYPLPKT
jgi:hypothetical protein